MSKCFIILFMTAVTSTWASNIIGGLDRSYWLCTAHDAEKNQWVIKSAYERVASTRAFDACKKQSQLPPSCNISQENCEYFSRGVSTRPMWQCTALDETAKPWVGRSYATKDDAALAANDSCHAHSRFPETCYINLITCTNLNKRS